MTRASTLLLLLWFPLVARADPFSHARPADAAVTHLTLELRVDFTARELRGSALLRLRRSAPGLTQEVVLDTKDLRIQEVTGAASTGSFGPLAFSLGPSDPVLGSALRVALPPGVVRVRVSYRTGREADALQWLTGRQTRTGRPFLYTQSGTIHARSWIPVQDSPGVRFTWDAAVEVPHGLVPVMSATRLATGNRTARFRMSRPVPAYLVALAVGDLAFGAWSARAGVFAERPVLARAQRELRHTGRMLEAAERLFGPYRWDRCDLLIMPPAFPYGGVENPQLTFVSPILIGDRGQLPTIAHEVAHAWAGNLVTQETWNDVWLNEGLAVYLERRIVEDVFGRERALAEGVLGRQALLEELTALAPDDQRLRVDFTGRDPDQILSTVPYEKGYLFFLAVERDAGRPRLDAFLRRLFRDRAFQAIDTDALLGRLKEELAVSVEGWVDAPGLPLTAPVPASAALEEAARAARSWLANPVPAAPPRRAWSAEQVAWFLASLPRQIPAAHAAALERAWHLNRSADSRVLVAWLRVGIRAGYGPAVRRAAELLGTVGRGSVVLPLYEDLLARPDGHGLAEEIYGDARRFYHPVVVAALDRRMGSGTGR